jgi:glycosyltransferase involved in cell wall biosynthesis
MMVVHPGLDYPAIVAAPDEAHTPLRIGYIGGLSSQKGVHTLIQAFTGLSARSPDQPAEHSPDPPAELWIAGDLTFDPDYVAHLRQLAGKGVRFTGRLTRDEVWGMLAQLDVIVVPSLWYETFCFVVSEAFAMGVPVIASDLGVLAERVRPGVDGLLFPPGDAHALTTLLRQCRDDPELLPRLQANIKSGPTVAQHADQIEAIYQRVIANRIN